MKSTIFCARFFVLYLVCCLLPAAGNAAGLAHPQDILRVSPDDAPSVHIGQDMSGRLHEIVSGSWGHDWQRAMVLAVPKNIPPNMLLGVSLNLLQEALVQFRKTVESKNGSRPLRCITATPTARVMHFAPGERILEKVSFMLICVEAELAAEVERMEKAGKEMSEEQNKKILASVRRSTEDIWFDTSEYVLYNATLLWGCTPTEVKKLFYQKYPEGRKSKQAVAMPAILQRSVFLAIAPSEFFRRDVGRWSVQNTGIISGGWGYSQADAFVIDLRPEQKGKHTVEFLEVQNTAFRVRSILELAHPLSMHSRLFPVSHKKDKQSLIKKQNKKYDKMEYVLDLLPQDAFMEYRKLAANDSQGMEKVMSKLVRRDKQEMWFDITVPFDNNTDALRAKIERQGQGF